MLDNIFNETLFKDQTCFHKLPAVWRLKAKLSGEQYLEESNSVEVAFSNTLALQGLSGFKIRENVVARGKDVKLDN